MEVILGEGAHPERLVAELLRDLLAIVKDRCLVPENACHI